MSENNQDINEENSIDRDFPFGEPKSEEDEPIKKDGKESFVPIQELTQQQINEKDKDRNDKKYFKAYDLIKICLAVLVKQNCNTRV